MKNNLAKIKKLRYQIKVLKRKYKSLEDELAQYSKYEQIEWDMGNVQDEVEELQEAIQALKEK